MPDVLYANMLIGFREGLEAAMVVLILAAYLKKTHREHERHWMWFGVLGALVVTVGVFLIIHFGTKTLSPMGQELVGGIASLVTVAMIAGMLYWMRKSSKDIAKELEGQMEEAVGPAAVFTVAFLAVGREGIETILLIFDSVTSTTATPFIGLAMGIACAVALGLLMYRGVLAINFHVFFQVIALLLVFVGAGIMRYGIHDLQEAGVLPGMDNIAFDASSWWVPGTWYASLMEGMFNIVPNPSVLSLIFWVIFAVMGLVFFFRTQEEEDQTEAAVEKQSVNA